ncbi:MAG: FkbM family methyltransferase [Acidobacteria bacterium]|nr:MAG: FkbM family methyltransferase [Acidobacteriota bacterium]
MTGPAAPLTVEVVALDDWAEAHHITPDWLIVDVEGFEEAVLAGAAGLIARHPGIGIVVELHPNAWSDAGTTRASMGALLARLGRRAVSLDGLSDPLSGYNQAVLEALPLI